MHQRASVAWDQIVRRVRSRVGPAPEATSSPAPPVPPLVWHAQAMVPRVDLRDKDAVMDAMERP